MVVSYDDIKPKLSLSAGQYFEAKKSIAGYSPAAFEDK
jgi:hypothetical protein